MSRIDGLELSNLAITPMNGTTGRTQVTAMVGRGARAPL